MDSMGDWPRFIATTRANLKQRLVPQDLSPEWIERQLQPMKCSPTYPELVAHNVLLARELCMVGSVFYELFTTSIQYSAAACEVALKERYLDAVTFPCRLTRKLDGVSEEKVWSRRPLVYEFVEAHEQGWRLGKPWTEFQPKLGYLIRWAKKACVISEQHAQWFDHRRRIRNTIAHGHNVIVSPSFALGTLRQTTVALNAMFPDPDTSAYDERMRLEREQREAEWWRELEGMHLSEDALAESNDEDEPDTL